MMNHMTLPEMEKATNGQLIFPENISNGQRQKLCQVAPTGIYTDNRELTENGIFAAIRGEKVDAHRFVNKALSEGALLCIVEEKPEEFLGDEPLAGPILLVPSVVKALQDLATYYRSTLQIPIVGIIGSVGKTSTKEMVASVLSQKYKTLKTKGNQNNAIGLPLTIFRINSDTEAAVVEMGISKFNEMHVLGEIAKPTHIVMTNIGTCHLEDLKDRDGVFKAKTEVFDHLSPEATLVLNGDDDHLSTVKNVGDAQIVFYGTENPSMENVKPLSSKSLGIHGIETTIQLMDGSTFTTTIPIPGSHNLMNALSAATIGSVLGLTTAEIAEGIKNVETIAGRSNFIDANGYTIIDDCYNANPMSMKASLEVLSYAEGRKIAVLGDMGELGENEKRYHYEVGEAVANNRIDLLVTLGPLSEEICRGAKDKGMAEEQIFNFQANREAIPFLQSTIEPGDSILIKASHYMYFSEIVSALQ